MNTPRHTSLSDWLAWIEGLHHAEIELGLERTQLVAQRLGLLNPKAKVVTVAGTNGKGSCVATLQRLLLLSDCRVGAYTSPHILHYNERISIDGENATDQDIYLAFEAVDQARGDLPLTYFEFGTLAALWLFSQQDLDYWILEVGMGGRLDAVNIVDCDLAIVTSIGLDHQAYLGDTREKIALEKAGILRQCKPVICADPNPPKTLVKAIFDNDSLAYFLNTDFSTESGDLPNQLKLNLPGNRQLEGLPRPQLPLPSVAAACLAAELCLKTEVEVSLLEKVFSSLCLAGRNQVLELKSGSGAPQQVLLDVAHNPEAMALLAKNLESRLQGRSCSAVLAMMADKSIRECLSPLIPLIDFWYLPLLADVPRAASPDEVESELLACGVKTEKIRQAATVSEALTHLYASSLSQPGENAQQGPLLLVTGSFYTVAEALDHFKHIGFKNTGFEKTV